MSKKHTPEQVIRKLREAEAELANGAAVAHVCRKLGVSGPTFHRWRNQHGGMRADDAKRLKDLEAENARLKKRVADLPLDRQVLQQVVAKKF